MYDRIHNADCIEWMNAQAEPFADLIFADPPFNIGYKYDVYEDRRAYDEYHAWTHDWMAACQRVLRPAGSFWIAIGDDYAAEVRMIGRDVGLHLRNWVIWHYTFGQQTKAKFARSHTHLFYFVNDPKQFTFNDRAVRVFSDRQRVYKDVRANAAGKLPDDTWNEFPRMCGTFAERLGWHPCQMPETVLARIIRACSEPGQTVFDPFGGSGTTLATARRLRRHYLGTELSPEYASGIQERLDAVVPMPDVPSDPAEPMPEAHLQELIGFYLEAATATATLHDNPRLLEVFTQHFNWRIEHSGCAGAYIPEQVWQALESLRRQARLGRVRVHAEENLNAPARPAPQDGQDAPQPRRPTQSTSSLF